MRIIGAVLAFGACGAIGVMRIFAERGRIELLTSLCDAFTFMKAELSAHLTALPELAKMLSQRGKGDAADFFSALDARMNALGKCCFDEIWRESATETLCLLKEDELQEVLSVGAVLGRGELEMQLNAIDRCVSSLYAALKRARTQHPQQRKLTLGVSLAAGTLIVVMLI